MQFDAISVTVRVTEVLEKLEVPYFIGGSLASTLYGMVRTTQWFQLGGEVSERQWRDVLGVIKVQAGALDTNYLHEWASKLNIVDLLQRALIEYNK